MKDAHAGIKSAPGERDRLGWVEKQVLYALQGREREGREDIRTGRRRGRALCLVVGRDLSGGVRAVDYRDACAADGEVISKAELQARSAAIEGKRVSRGRIRQRERGDLCDGSGQCLRRAARKQQRPRLDR